MNFTATAVRFEMPSPLPFHVGGDVQPPRGAFTASLAARTVPILRRGRV